MDVIMKALIICMILGCVYGAPADTVGSPNKEEKMTETIEQTDDVKGQEGDVGLTVFTDVTHGLLVHRYKTDVSCYISSLADYKDIITARGGSSSLITYRLEPISEINLEYFSHTATDAMKRVCNGASNALWSEIHVISGEVEARKKRDVCVEECTSWWDATGMQRACRCVYVHTVEAKEGPESEQEFLLRHEED